MAGSSSFTYDKSNPFFAADDVDDATFLRSAPKSNYETSSFEDRRQQLMEEKRKIEERTVMSSFRSISLLQESEEIGTATSRELVSQRNQLENTERKLDEINNTLRTSQKHIQGIKSVFGSIKNYFSGTKNEVSLPKSIPEQSEADEATEGEINTKNELSRILQSSKLKSANDGEGDEYENHPAIRMKSGNSQMNNSKSVDEILDNNLMEMSHSLSRLKLLGMGLNDELNEQNDIVERVTTKAENVDHRIQNQTKDMNRILKK